MCRVTVYGTSFNSTCTCYVSTVFSYRIGQRRFLDDFQGGIRTGQYRGEGTTGPGAALLETDHVQDLVRAQ